MKKFWLKYRKKNECLKSILINAKKLAKDWDEMKKLNKSFNDRN